MKNLKRIVLLSLVVLMVLGALPANAIIPYSSYTYDIDGNYVESPHAYVPYEVITSLTLGMGDSPITDPQDFCTGRNSVVENASRYFYWDNRIYISDTNTSKENPRVVIAEYDKEESGFRYVTEINKFVNEWGIPDKITSPRGLYVIDGQLYVCDIDSARILVFATRDGVEYNGKTYKMGQFIRTIAEPESEVISDNHVYRPLAVAVSASGYIYVVGESTHQGVISINGEGEFAGFIGTQSQSLTFFDMLWRKLQTEEQRNKTVKNVSTSFNNININEKGFVFATTDSINDDDLLKAITAKAITSDVSPVKMLNPNGEDVMKRSGFFPPVGEVTFQTQATPEYDITGPSKVVDVGLGPEGTWSIIDAKRQKIFTYDEDGNLLFAFGDKGSQLGNISLVKAIDYAYGTVKGSEEEEMNYLMVLDGTNDAITVYKRTEYGDVLVQALKNQRDRLFDKSEEDWREILQRNSNFDMSYIGIGKSLARQEKYSDAMEMFKAAYDTENYSEAWQQVRKAWVEDWVLVVPAVIIVFFVLVSMLFKYADKVNAAGLALRKKRSLLEEFMYGFHVMFHPFDGYWDIKHEYRASVKGASLILGLTVLSFIYYSIGQAYVIKPTPDDTSVLMMFASILLPIALWVIANWCLTTLFDGEGSIKDIYIATCYALFPLPPFLVLTTLLSNIVTVDEAGLLTLALGVALFWCGFLLFFGMQVIHDYTLYKNVLTTLASIVGMAFIMFIGVLFSSLLGKIVTFVINIVVELSYRV